MAHCIAIIGAGGKTTAMITLARALESQRVLVTTTTHIYPVSPLESRELLVNPTSEELRRALEKPGIVCAGNLEGEGKLSGLGPGLLARAGQWADWILCEADGAKRLPLKLHREGEPVIPPETERCLLVLGLSAVDQPVSKVVHRYRLDPAWEQNPETIVEETVLCRCAWDGIRAGGLPLHQYRVLLNQAETPRQKEIGNLAARMLRREGVDCWVGSLWEDPESILAWLLP